MTTRNITRILVIMTVLLISIMSAQAATLTCEQVSSASLSIPQFSSKTVEIKCTASGGTVSNVQISPNANPSTGLTTTSSQTIGSSISSGSSSTAKWSVTGSSPNTYTMSYTVSSDGSNTWTGASTSSITVPAPAQLTVEYVLPPSIFTPTVTTLGIRITNVGGTTANNVKLKLNNYSTVNFPTTIAAGATSSYQWTNGTGFNESGTYTTYVYLGDVLHDSATAVVNVASSEISMNNEWNLISLARSPADNSVGAVLDSIDGEYDDVWGWDGATQTWLSYYAPFPGDATLTYINESMGFWLRRTSYTTNLSVEGDTVSSLGMTVYPDWNMIGYPIENAQDIGVALADIDGSYDDVWAWDGSVWTSYYAPFPGDATVTQLQQNKGYWVRVTAGSAQSLTLS